MQPVKIYTTGWCSYCQRALEILKSAGVADLQEIRVDEAPEQKKSPARRNSRAGPSSLIRKRQSMYTTSPVLLSTTAP